MEELWINSPKKIDGNVNEIIEEKPDSDSEESYDEMSNFEKIGVILMQFEDILEKDNLERMLQISLNESKENKHIIETISRLTKKYKDEKYTNIINELITNVFISSNKFDIEDNTISISLKSFENIIFDYNRFNFDIEQYEVILDDYIDVLKTDSIILYFKYIRNIDYEYDSESDNDETPAKEA